MSSLPIAEFYLSGIPRGAVAVLCDGGDPAPAAAEIMNSLAEHGYESVATTVTPRQPDAAAAPAGDLAGAALALADHLATRGWRPGQIAILGYGLGGRVAFDAAARAIFGASVSISPRACAGPAADALTEMAGRAEAIRTPWLGLIGGASEGALKSAARDLGAALAARAPAYTQVVTYRTSAASLYSQAADSAAYAAAFDAWQRTIEWLNLQVAPRLTPLARAWRARGSDRVTT